MLKKEIRIIQLIDSLEAGGAERMAVNYANGLHNLIDFSGLVCTRKEGDLNKQLLDNLPYGFLNKKNQFDIKAFWKLKKNCEQNSIDFIHAHSSSFFWAVLVRLFLPRIKIIWHDHYGNSEFLAERPKYVLRFFSYFFYAIIVVNNDLLEWSKKNLKCKKIIFLNNFSLKNETQIQILNEDILKGEKGKKILCLANLRPQKDHFFLLEIAEKVIQKHKDWTFHLVGKDFNDSYSQEIKKIIQSKSLQSNVFIYGSRSETDKILDEATIGILTSKSEGLPVALIEYGMRKLPVVVTNVGEIGSFFTEKLGFIVGHNDIIDFSNSIIKYIEDVNLREFKSLALHTFVEEKFSSKGMLKQYLDFIDE